MTVPQAIIIGFPISAIVLAVLLVIGAKKIGQSVWTTLAAVGTVVAAVGTVGAVTWAIFSQGILASYNQPVLQLNEVLPLNQVPIYISDQSVDPKTKKKKIYTTRHILYFKFINTGRTIARDARPFITAVASTNETDDKWKLVDNWTPVSLIWAYEYYETRITGLPSEDKNLIQHRPYLFELGWFGEKIPEVNTEKLPNGWPVEQFRMSWSTALPNLPQDYGIGKHCFEITAYAEGAETTRKYVIIDWKGGRVPNKKNCKISAQDNRPKFWPNT